VVSAPIHLQSDHLSGCACHRMPLPVSEFPSLHPSQAGRTATAGDAANRDLPLVTAQLHVASCGCPTSVTCLTPESICANQPLSQIQSLTGRGGLFQGWHAPRLIKRGIRTSLASKDDVAYSLTYSPPPCLPVALSTVTGQLTEPDKVLGAIG